MLSNELVPRDSFNFIPWKKNSTSSRGFFRGRLLLPKCPRTRKNISLQRATRSNFDAQPVKKSDQRFSSTLYTNGPASLMFSHGIIHLSFSLSSIYPSVTRAAIPDLRVRQKKKAHSDSHEYVTSVCQPRYFSLFEGRERRGERKFHRLPKCWISMESRDASTIGKREGGNENGIWKSWKSFHFDDEER